MKKHQIKFVPALIILFALIIQVFYPLNYNFSYSKQTPTSLLENNIGASLEDQLKKIEADLQKIQNEKEAAAQNKITDQRNITEFQRQIKELNSKVDELEFSIKQKELELQQLEIQIQLLEEEITKLELQIEDTKDEISILEKETDKRLLNMYLQQKLNISTSNSFFSSNGPSGLIKTDIYRQAVQEDTNIKLELLEEKRVQLERDQNKLEEDKISLDRSRRTIEETKILLDVQKTEIINQQAALQAKSREAQGRLNGYDELIAILASDEKELFKNQDAIKSQLLARNEVANGVPVTAGTFIGIEGNTGYSYGAHLHFGVSVNGAIQNPCSYLPSGAYGGCGGNGTLIKPLSGGILTSGFRTSSRPTHNAIDISTGGGGTVVAAHDGYAYFFFEPCPASAAVCNGGGAIVAKVCETDKCASGISTVYYHLSCTAEPSSSPRSCKK